MTPPVFGRAASAVVPCAAVAKSVASKASKRSALRLATFVVEVMINGAVPSATPSVTWSLKLPSAPVILLHRWLEEPRAKPRFDVGRKWPVVILNLSTRPSLKAIISSPKPAMLVSPSASSISSLPFRSRSPLALRNTALSAGCATKIFFSPAAQSTRLLLLLDTKTFASLRDNVFPDAV